MATSKLHFKYVDCKNCLGRDMVSTHIQPIMNSDQDMLASNGVFTAFQAKQTGAFFVSPANDFRRYDDENGLVYAHQGIVYDLQFSPFYKNLLASCGEDGKVKLWVLPDGGFGKGERQEDVLCDDKAKKMHCLDWHKITDNTLASAAYDNIVRVWDIEKQKVTVDFDNVEGQISCMRWGIDGKTLSTVDKKKQLVINDVRGKDRAQVANNIHGGAQKNKLVHLDNEHVLTTGHSKTGSREYAIWDRRAMDKEVARGGMGSGINTLRLYYDEDLKLIFAASPGEAEISLWQYDNTVKGMLVQGSSNKFQDYTRATHLLPKSMVDPKKNEIARMARIDAKGNLAYLAFTQPSRTASFLDALYPPMKSATPAQTHEEWLASPEPVEPIRVTLTFDTTQAELINKKAPNAFMEKYKPRSGQTPKQKVVEGGSENNEVYLAKIAELEAHIKKVTAENAELKVPKPAHSLNLKSKPTLGYWNIRGLGAPIRYMLYYCGVEFTDKMYRAGPPPEYDRSDWLNEKFNLGLPLPNLPYLIDEDARLTETVAIMKYIAGKWKPELLGKDPTVMAELEML